MSRKRLIEIHGSEDKYKEYERSRKAKYRKMNSGLKEQNTIQIIQQNITKLQTKEKDIIDKQETLFNKQFNQQKLISMALNTLSESQQDFKKQQDKHNKHKLKQIDLLLGQIEQQNETTNTINSIINTQNQIISTQTMQYDLLDTKVNLLEKTNINLKTQITNIYDMLTTQARFLCQIQHNCMGFNKSPFVQYPIFYQ
jgi:hypothetical protein